MNNNINVYDMLYNEFVKRNIVENENPEHVSAVRPKFVKFITDEFEDGYFHDLTDFLILNIQSDKQDEEKRVLGKKMMPFVKNYFQVYSYLSGSKKITYWNALRGENKTNFIDSVELLAALYGNPAYAYDEELKNLIKRMGSRNQGKLIPNGNSFISYKETLNYLGQKKEMEDIFGVKIDYKTFIFKKEVTTPVKSANLD